MRRMLQRGVLAASLAVPTVSLASPVRDPAAAERIHMQTDSTADRRLKPWAQPTNPGGAATGGGMVGGNDPGHVTGPGQTQVDTDTRGPINDVQPGRGSADTPQSRDPPPAR